MTDHSDSSSSRPGAPRSRRPGPQESGRAGPDATPRRAPQPIDSASELTGKLLIAMPGMSDPRFDRSVIYLCAHSDRGGMGLIVNKPTPDLRLTDLLEQLSIPAGPACRNLPVHFGGPVEHGRGFVLHSGDYESRISSLEIDGRFAMTGTLDILEDLAGGAGPERAIMALGYAGWGPGQLEDEIARNGWLTCDAPPDLVFGADHAGKWQAALGLLGIDALSLSAEAGRA